MLRLKRLLLYRSRKRKQASGVLTQLQPDNIHQRDLPQKETGNLETQENSALTVEELANAEMEIICFCQKKRFADEISSLRKGMNVKRTSHIPPILENGILRVGGRLSRAAMPEEMKHPDILAKDFHISDLILRHVHEEVGHCGCNQKNCVEMCCLSVYKCYSWTTADGRFAPG